MADDATYVFRYGADMEPTTILTAQPGARFVARAWVPAAATALPPLPEIGPPPHLPGGAVSPPGSIWGILLRVPAGSSVDRVASGVRATTDDGRVFAAVVGGDGSADPPAILAAARYWELPPAYVRRLAAWVDASG